MNDHRLPPLDGGTAQSAVILLHGLGDSGAGLIDLGVMWRQHLPQTLFVAPDAPYPCDMAPMGHQWFSLQDRTPLAILTGVQQAAPLLNAYIDQIMAETALAADRIALVGFSQGTMMSLYVAPRRSEALAGVIGYSGALVGAETLGFEQKSRPPVLLVHGTQDDVVPFSAMSHAEYCLRAVGMSVSTQACPALGHSIDQIGLNKGLGFLQKVLANPTKKEAIA